jgi:hypothetical protein
MASDPPTGRIGRTFSQAHGLEPLPQPLALGQVSNEFRLDIWNWLYDKIDHNSRYHAQRNWIVGHWRTIFSQIHSSLFYLPLDKFDGAVDDIVIFYKPAILSGRNALSFSKLFDLLQFMLRLPIMAQEVPKAVMEIHSIIRRNMLAYDLLDIPPDGPTIVPNATPEEGEAVRQAFIALSVGRFDGARTHLRKAAESINSGQATDAIREAIHAVESIVRVIAPNKNFRDALAALNAQIAIHPAFRDALLKLYGYSSDEKGIRHPLLESDDATRVGMTEAVFMFGACASFITYLISRARQSGLLKA